MHDDRSHDDLDQIIDDTARAFTSAEPPPQLRARVRERITRAGESPPSVWRRPMFALGALGAIAVIVVPLAIRERQEPRSGVEQPTAFARSSPLPLASAPAPVLPHTVESDVGQVTARPRPRGDRFVPNAPRVQITAPDEPSELPFPPVAIPELMIEPLQQNALTVEDIPEAIPLQPEGIAIAPLVIE